MRKSQKLPFWPFCAIYSSENKNSEIYSDNFFCTPMNYLHANFQKFGQKIKSLRILKVTLVTLLLIIYRADIILFILFRSWRLVYVLWNTCSFTGDKEPILSATQKQNNDRRTLDDKQRTHALLNLI